MRLDGARETLAWPEKRDHRQELRARSTREGQLKYESAAQLVPILRPLIAPASTIAVYPASNTLVIADYADNLQRISRIIDAIDQPCASDPVVIPLAHASALDVARLDNLRPTVPRDAQRADSITGSRYDYILGEQDKATPPHNPPPPRAMWDFMDRGIP